MKYDNIEGKFTLDIFARNFNITQNSALNVFNKLKKQNRLIVNGGGKQKRIYTISKLSFKKTNGFYDIVNKYSKIKLIPQFNHFVHGRYTIEEAIIDGLKIGDSRTLEATAYLFKHVKNWTKLFNLAKNENLAKELQDLHKIARKKFKCRKLPLRYQND